MDTYIRLTTVNQRELTILTLVLPTTPLSILNPSQESANS